MPSKISIYGLIKRKFDEIGLNADHYSLGEEYKDDSDALYDDGEYWYVGGMIEANILRKLGLKTQLMQQNILFL
jgi:hypothetical protein